MRKLVVIFCSLPLFSIGQIHFYQPEEIKVQVNGDTVTLRQDTAFRNCGAEYNMKVLLLADTLFWLQEDTGSVVGCDCHFDLSVRVDSLSTGNYIAKVYYTAYPWWPPPYPDTVYVGSVPFQITDQNFTSSVHPIEKIQSDCFFVGIENKKNEDTESVSLYPNPANNFLTIQSNAQTERVVKIYDHIGRPMLITRIKEGKEIIDISGFIPGIYLIRVETEMTAKRLIFIKQ